MSARGAVMFVQSPASFRMLTRKGRAERYCGGLENTVSKGQVRTTLRTGVSLRMSVQKLNEPVVVEVYDAHTHLGSTLDRLKQAIDPQSIPKIFSKEDERCTIATHTGASFSLRGCINVNCWSSSSRTQSFESGLRFQRALSNIYGTYGLHPHYAQSWSDDVESRMREALTDAKSVAVGECGLDFYRNLSDENVQTKVFVKQIRIARELELPLVIHARDAELRALEVLSTELPADWPIHLHCYTGPKDVALMYLQRFDSLCIGFTGCITFKNNNAVREVVAAVPLERLLLETDAPYMAPAPFRGKVCTSAQIGMVAAKIAEIKKRSLGDVARITSQNCERLYRLPAYSQKK